jgi:hypothetical protein
MTTTYTTPDMNLVLPIAGPTGEAGPTYATDINSALEKIDLHDHTPGNGASIKSSSVSVISNLIMGGYSLSSLGSIIFSDQSSYSIADAMYTIAGDLYFRDGANNQIRITAGGAISAGSFGGITGMDAYANVVYVPATKTFTFTQSTSKTAGVVVGNLGISYEGTTSQNPIFLQAPSGVVSSYSIILPAAVATSAGSVLVSDTSGNTSWSSVGYTPIGGVIQTFPNLTGAYNCTATTAADTYGFVLCGGQTIVDATSPMNGQVIPNLNGSKFIMGSSIAGSAGGSNTSAHTHTVATPSHYHTLDNNGGAEINCYYGSSWTIQFGPSGGATFTPSIVNTCSTGGGSGSPSTASGTMLNGRTADITVSGSTTSSTPSNADQRPAYITAVFIMRIK